MAASAAADIIPRNADVPSINDSLGDDELRAVLLKLENDKDKEIFGLVCKRWLHLQSTERRKLCARAGPHMLRKMAVRFTRLIELDLSQSTSRSFYPGVTDSDLSVIATAFSCLRVLTLQNCKEVVSSSCLTRMLFPSLDQRGLMVEVVSSSCLTRMLFPSLDQRGITDVGMKAIAASLPHLQSLDVSYCRKLTDKGLSAVVQGSRDLRIFHLAGCRFVTDSLLRALSENCNNLEELGLQGCSCITDSGLAVLVEGCQRVKYLDINKCSNVGDVGISSVCRACSSLKTLKLLDCYKVGDESILSLANFCKSLETLIIGGCRDITDESLKQLATASNSLRNLRMDWCLNVSDSSLECILQKCKKLEVLDIGCCEEVTDAAFQGLGSGILMLQLKILKVSNCPKITVVGIGNLLTSCNSLEYLDVRSCPHVTKAGCDEAGLLFPDSCKVNFTGSLTEPDVLL